MARFVECERCGQTAWRSAMDGHRFLCPSCKEAEEPIPYDRLHYFEDEDIFPQDDFWDECSEDGYESEDKDD